ncbi:hypothetical protein G6L13_03890 [Agrobacterium tumefaciens]|nr:hypothetical protein [Agrobacterium tumefaciens]NTA79624.1 hypothetical protein [Agrobacterium tumefaciens]
MCTFVHYLSGPIVLRKRVNNLSQFGPVGLIAAPKTVPAVARFYNQSAFMESVGGLHNVTSADASLSRNAVRSGVALSGLGIEMCKQDRAYGLRIA